MPELETELEKLQKVPISALREKRWLKSARSAACFLQCAYPRGKKRNLILGLVRKAAARPLWTSGSTARIDPRHFRNAPRKQACADLRSVLSAPVRQSAVRMPRRPQFAEMQKRSSAQCRRAMSPLDRSERQLVHGSADLLGSAESGWAIPATASAWSQPAKPWTRYVRASLSSIR
jgi:hypothetical protein